MELTFSPAGPEDADAILAMSEALVRQYEDPAAVDLPAVLAWLERKTTGHIAEYTRIRADGETAGYFRLTSGEDAAELDDLYILPQFRRRGIGSAVLRRCIRATDQPLMLYVFTGNTGAVELYRRHGFSITKYVGSTRCIMARDPGGPYEDHEANLF